MVRCRCLIAVCTLALAASAAQAKVPVAFTEVQLAQSPIVVIGYWPDAIPKASRTKFSPSIISGKVTNLTVTQVLHGDLQPGKYDLRLDGWVQWEADGTGPYAAGDAVTFGDINDVSKPYLWFLRSEKEENGKTRLVVENYRSVQDSELLPYYEVLRKEDRGVQIRQCLESKNPRIVGRALEFVSNAGIPTLILNSGSFRPVEAGDLNSQLDGLRKIIAGNMQPFRPKAVAIYADKTWQNGRPLLQSLLRDADPNVSVVAAAFLVKLRDTGSLSTILEESGQPASSELLIALVDAMKDSGDLRYVPSLIGFLQYWPLERDMFDMNSPARSAQEALTALTGFTFPFDVRSSVNAWAMAAWLSPKQRTAKLEQILGSWDSPLSAEAHFERYPRSNSPKASAEVQVTNRTNHPISLMSIPSFVEQKPDSSAGRGIAYAVSVPGAEYPGKPVVIEPGKSIHFTILPENIVSQAGTAASMKLHYADRDKPTGSTCWIGDITVKLVK